MLRMLGALPQDTRQEGDTSRIKGATQTKSYALSGLSSPEDGGQPSFPCPGLGHNTEVHLVVSEICHLSRQIAQMSQQEDWP